MNYRHIYHAGNFADVMKHLALVLALDHMRKKDAPFCVIDAHGGVGLYDLSSDEAQKTKEAEKGIRSIAAADDMPDDVRLYYDLVERDMRREVYPGSPLLAARMLRPQDRLIANELHPVDLNMLKINLQETDRAQVTNLDAYECLRAHLPPPERRGLILIDPPFEKKDEFETLSRQMAEWKKRFATGTYIVWYPIKAHLAIAKMKEAARALALPRTWMCETMLHPKDREDILTGCGILVFNAPYLFPERYEAVLPFLKNSLSLHGTVTEWLVQDTGG